MSSICIRLTTPALLEGFHGDLAPPFLPGLRPPALGPGHRPGADKRHPSGSTQLGELVHEPVHFLFLQKSLGHADGEAGAARGRLAAGDGHLDLPGRHAVDHPDVLDPGAVKKPDRIAGLKAQHVLDVPRLGPGERGPTAGQMGWFYEKMAHGGSPGLFSFHPYDLRVMPAFSALRILGVEGLRPRLRNRCGLGELEIHHFWMDRVYGYETIAGCVQLATTLDLRVQEIP